MILRFKTTQPSLLNRSFDAVEIFQKEQCLREIVIPVRLETFRCSQKIRSALRVFKLEKASQGTFVLPQIDNRSVLDMSKRNVFKHPRMVSCARSVREYQRKKSSTATTPIMRSRYRQLPTACATVNLRDVVDVHGYEI